MRSVLVACVLCVLSCPPAWGHDLWLERSPDGVVLYYGHKHSSHEGAELVEYSPQWVQETVCVDRQGIRVPVVATETYPVRIDAACAAAYVRLSSGYWTKTPYGTRNVPKAEVEMAIKSWLSIESVKRIDEWSESLARPVTRGLELTPLFDPTKLRPGDKLRLLVTLGGRPVSGAIVAYDDNPRGQSGEDGRINVRIRHGGFQRVEAMLKGPDPSGKGDEIVRTSSLNFELPAK